ncbi:UNKNOWN [Stylonychia lemnae]|uniref:Uncharacterized protein n=1 Tax=Stylonychia lemnae TaxID=5949 RepID=A0A077ZZ50_STYLE|nr:UNKNOWN [Stylonychia lemnae]|eukprot:CDW74488.1 UNKNOWN [Stylonychia lemnae]
MNTPTRMLFKRQMPVLQMTQAPIRGFYYPDANHHHLNQEPHVLAKRIIKVVGERLRHIDHNRWDGVPVTFKTHWNSENGEIDIKTCILIHDIIEREFNIDIDDRKILLQSIQDCFHFIMSLHTAI